MRLSRHAKNRLRWIRRDSPDISEAELLKAVSSTRIHGHDAKGSALYAVVVAGLPLLVVVDEHHGVVVTIWREE
jgi:hypothetical protein